MSRATEHQSSFLSRMTRRNQVVSINITHEQELQEHEEFQKHVAEHFTELSQPSDSPILSIQWLQKLLNIFLSMESEFHSILTSNPSQISKPPLDKLIPEMLDRIIKALDICTSVVNGVDSVRQIKRFGEITVTALKQTPLSDGSVRRGKRALTSLLSGRKSTSSFGRCNNKQIQAMTTNIIPPRGLEGSPIYIMNSVMVLVMWILVIAVPCQRSNGFMVNLPLLKNQVWGSSVVMIYEKIGEEVKKKSGGGGLMEEIVRMERIGVKLMEFCEGFRFDGEEDVTVEVAEMEEICGKMEDGLEGLERRIREVFHRLVKSRSEILEVIGH